MRLLAALMILLPIGALAQPTTTTVDPSSNPTSTYGGGSAYGVGGSGYDGGGIGSVMSAQPNSSVEPKAKTRGLPPNMGGDYGYSDKSKPAQPR